MEEKDMLEKIENIISYYAQSDDKEVYDGAMLFKKLLQAYKQDEKVIEEMASYLVKDCEQIEKLECEEIVKRLEKTPYNCIDCIISCFRKKCE